MSENPKLKAAVLGAGGAVGALICAQLRRSGYHVTGYDLRSPSQPAECDAFVAADLLSPTGEVEDALAASDLAIVCLPHEAAVAAIGRLLRSLPASALLIDTLSVKSPVSDLLKSTAGQCEYLSINPMFAPSLGFAGQKTVVVPCRSGQRAAAFMEMLKTWGSTVEQMSVEQHDRVCAVMQAATHIAILALGQTIRDSGVSVADILKIAPPPHLMCLALLSRILSAAPETYWDIQRDNPYAAEVRQQLAASLAQFDALAKGGDFAGFAATLQSIRKTLGDKSDLLNQVAADALKIATQTSRNQPPNSR